MLQRVPDTKERILDAAEKLFGINGFEATSLRDITAEAGVNLAAVNYHFQSKESLIDAAIARRMEPVNKKRVELLEAAGVNATLEQILIAFLQPVLDWHVAPALALMGQVLATPDALIARMFKKHVTSVSQRFIDALAKALPELSRADLLWRLSFTGGAIGNVLARGRVISEISGGLCDPADRPALLARLVTFAAAGFRANAWGGETA